MRSAPSWAGAALLIAEAPTWPTQLLRCGAKNKPFKQRKVTVSPRVPLKSIAFLNPFWTLPSLLKILLFQRKNFLLSLDLSSLEKSIEFSFFWFLPMAYAGASATPFLMEMSLLAVLTPFCDDWREVNVEVMTSKPFCRHYMLRILFMGCISGSNKPIIIYKMDRIARESSYCIFLHLNSREKQGFEQRCNLASVLRCSGSEFTWKIPLLSEELKRYGKVQISHTTFTPLLEFWKEILCLATSQKNW